MTMTTAPEVCCSRPHRPSCGWILPVAALMLSGCATVPKPTAVDGEAEAVLRAMSTKLASAETLSFRARRTIDAQLVPGAEVKRDADVRVTVARPNRVAASATDSEGTRRFWFDGTTVTLYDGAAGTWASAAMPGTIDAMIDGLQEKFETHPPLADLLVADPYANLTRGGGSATLAGTEAVGGVACRRVSAVQATVDWDLWVAESDDLPRRIVIRFKGVEGSPELRADFSNWNLGVRVSGDDFKPSIPKSAQNIQMVPTN